MGLGLVSAVLAGASPASAATTRYVSPSGATTGSCASPSNPCTLFRASQVTGQGDEVVLASGTYNNQSAAFNKGEYVHGAPGASPPVLKGSQSYQLLAVSNDGRAENLRLEQSGSGPALRARDGRIQNVIASSSGPTVELEGGNRVRELVASTTGPSSVAIRVLGGPTFLTNVTAYAVQTTSVGILIGPSASDSTPYVGAQNVIARGGGFPGINIQGTSPQQPATLDIHFSNHNGINATYADVGEVSNQSGAPSFVNAAAGNFHQTAVSVTRDAGQAPADASATDIDGDQRVVGQIDIGADEWTPAPIAATAGATLIGSTVATVNGSVDPRRGNTTYYFQWGPTAAYGNPSGLQLLFARRAAGNGAVPVPVSRKLTGLKPSTTYHYRLRASNQTGTGYGIDAVFTTGPPGTPDPGGSGPEPGQPGGAVLTLTGASLKPARFRVAKGRTAVSAQRRRRKPIPRGTTFRYTLSAPATVKIVIRRKLAGRRKAKRCVRPTRRLRRAKRCTRLLTKGTLTRRSKLGANSTRFTGRIGRRKLAPGKYAAVLTATDIAGNRSRARTLAFTGPPRLNALSLRSPAARRRARARRPRWPTRPRPRPSSAAWRGRSGASCRWG